MLETSARLSPWKQNNAQHANVLYADKCALTHTHTFLCGAQAHVYICILGRLLMLCLVSESHCVTWLSNYAHNESQCCKVYKRQHVKYPVYIEALHMIWVGLYTHLMMWFFHSSPHACLRHSKPGSPNVITCVTPYAVLF